MIGGIIVVLAIAIKQGWITSCIRIIECCLPKHKKGVERPGEIHRRNDDGSGPGQVSGSGHTSRFKGAQGEEALEDCEDDIENETIAPANKKIRRDYTHGGQSFADAATAALAAKQLRHYQQQQQLNLRQQQQQQMENQLIGAYFDPNTNNNNSGASTTSSPTYSNTPQMMFYPPQESSGPPVPLPRIPPSSEPLLTSPPRLTRAQTFQAHMFESQDSSPPNPVRRWNSSTPNSPPPQYTAYNNPLSCQQQQQNEIGIKSNSPKPIPYAFGSPATQLQPQERLQQPNQDHQQQPVAPPCWLVNTMGENDDVAITIGPMAAPSNRLQALSKEQQEEEAVARPMQTEVQSPPPSSPLPDTSQNT